MNNDERIVYELELMPEFLAWQGKIIGLFASETAAWDWVSTYDPDRNDPYFYRVTARVVNVPKPIEPQSQEGSLDDA